MSLSASGTHCDYTFRAYLSLKLSFNTDQNTDTMEDEISSSQLFPLDVADMSSLLADEEWNSFQSFDFSEFRPLTQSDLEEKVRKRFG